MNRATIPLPSVADVVAMSHAERLNFLCTLDALADEVAELRGAVHALLNGPPPPASLIDAKEAARRLGVSVDTAESHKNFCAKEGLNFKLLADPGAKVSEQYGSTMEYNGEKLAARNTFIINPKGEIAKVFTGVKPTEHSEQVLKALAELQKG